MKLPVDAASWLRFFAWLWRLFSRVFRRPKPPPELPTEPFDALSREHTAIHEAGHAVIAWRSSVVVSVRIKIHERGGAVIAPVHSIVSAEEMWLGLVTLLGGIAAECDVYGQFRSGPSSDDLTKARYFAERLSELGFAPKTEEKGGPDFCRVFLPALSDGELRMLRAAFLEARRLVTESRARHRALAHMLKEQDELGPKELEAVLGSRFHATFLGAIGIASFSGRARVRLTAQ